MRTVQIENLRPHEILEEQSRRNLIYLPIGGKLKGKSEEEARNRYMQLEGILAIQAGENPRVVRDKLSAYLAPKDIKGEDKAGNAKGSDKKAAAGKAEKAQA